MNWIVDIADKPYGEYRHPIQWKPIFVRMDATEEEVDEDLRVRREKFPFHLYRKRKHDPN